MQLALFQWTKWYRALYEMPSTDRPADAIIEDDARLDAWYKQFTKDAARGRRAQGVSLLGDERKSINVFQEP